MHQDQKARSKKQEARSKKQEARSKKQEARDYYRYYGNLSRIIMVITLLFVPFYLDIKILDLLSEGRKIYLRKDFL